MNSIIFDNTLVKDIHFEEIRINCLENITIEAVCTIGSRKEKIIFERISELCLDCVNWPFVVHGFEILDNLELGWEKSARFRVQDYEDGLISFFCQNINIMPLN
jgi:hypothetical protein